jgi:hypothetical protein
MDFPQPLGRPCQNGHVVINKETLYYAQWYFSMKLVKNFFWIFLSCGNLLSVILYQNALKSSLLVYKWYKNHIMSFKVGLC